MRHCLLVFLIARLLVQFAPAQTRSGLQGLALDSVVTNSRSDSVLAIHRLFQSRRTSGKILTIGAVPIALGATFVGALITVGNYYNNAGSPRPIVDGIASGIALAGLLPGIIGIPQLIRFRKKKENALVSAYEQGGPLPVSVRRRLKPNYFR
ncbi:MAG: hypothetical protein JWP57_487 [Spirosoma sp.]|nr:hypothetical protein [Spirosoma sp.]